MIIDCRRRRIAKAKTEVIESIVAAAI